MGGFGISRIIEELESHSINIPVKRFGWLRQVY